MKKRIALIAHDKEKGEMIELASEHNVPCATNMATATLLLAQLIGQHS